MVGKGRFILMKGGRKKKGGEKNKEKKMKKWRNDADLHPQ